MSRTDFDWQIGEDNWDTTATVEQSAPIDEQTSGGFVEKAAGHEYRRRLFGAILILALLLAAGYLLIAHRVEDVTKPIEKDVLATHQLVEQAMTRSDADLFTSLQFEPVWNWGKAQKDLFAEGWFYDRSPFGLQVHPSDLQKVEVRLASDLHEAEVVAEHAYSVAAGNGSTETVRLQQTTTYRFDRNRWLLAAPEDTFWGTTITTDKQYLTLAYPERDQVIGLRMAADLDSAIGKMCANLDRLCPSDFKMRVWLGTQLSILVDTFLQDDRFYYGGRTPGGIDVQLPAPTLVGVPIDEAGYRALYRGYAVRVLREAFDEMTGRKMNWLTQAYIQAALDRELVRLAVRPWPLSNDSNDQTPPPIPFPDQDIAVYCVDSLPAGGNLYRYRPATGTWSRSLSSRVFTSMTALPDGSAIVLQEQPVITDSLRTRILLWQDDTERTLAAGPTIQTPLYFSGQFDPTGRYLVVYYNTDPSSSPFPYGLLDRESCSQDSCDDTMLRGWRSITMLRHWFCSQDSCDDTMLRGWPVWSPDGSRTLLSAYEELRGTVLLRGDAQGQSVVPIGEGDSPFWLDNQTYGYSLRRESTSSRPTLDFMIASTADDRPQLLLRADDLLDAIPVERRPDGIDWAYAVANPANPSLLLLIGVAVNEQNLRPSSLPDARAYFFLFDRESGRASLQFEYDGSQTSVDFSPNGQWLTVAAPDSTGLLQLLDVDQNRTVTFHIPAYTASGQPLTLNHWSIDGRWLLVVRDGALHLIAPDYDYRQTIVPESPGCLFGAWINHR